MFLLRAAACTVLLLMTALVSPALAEDVTLTSRDGSVKVAGNLLGYDGEFYRVDTEYGVLTLDGSGVICDGPGCPDLTAFVAELSLSGAPTMGAILLPALLETFAARNGFAARRIVQSDERFIYELSERASGAPAARFAFFLSSTDEGFADLISDEADIALSLREVSPDEAALARTGDLGDLTAPGRSRIVALDAMVPLVADSNSVSTLRMSDLAAVFAGDITTWEGLGGVAEPIVLHLRDDNSGLVQAFRRRVMEEYDITALAPGIIRHASNAALADAVAGDPFALGIGSFSEIGNAVPLTISGPCSLSADATVTNIKSEDYPLTAPMFVYLPDRRLPRIARDFLRYIASPAAQPVIRRAGFVDQFPAAMPFQEQGQRFANAIESAGVDTDLVELQRMVRVLSGHSRLTVTFRFEGGSSELDAQSRSNVALLAEALERGVFDDHELVFVGFSDGDGPGAINRRLSQTRARAVREAVRTAARTVDPTRLTLRTEAFGEAMPMACDEVPWGRRVNRRVEVWLK